MASPLQTGKKSVNLATQARASRIRRDPPPVAQKIIVRDPEERDARTVLIGIVAFALAIFIIILGVSAYYGSSPEERTIHLNLD